MYSIRVDRERLLVEMRLTGFFTGDLAAEAVEALRRAIESLGPQAGQHVTLFDATAIDICPPATIDYIQACWVDPAIRPLWARRVAYCTPSALTRMQAKRLRESRSDIGVFASREEALAWLLDPSAAPDTQAA